jgi:hypothetical protein
VKRLGLTVLILAAGCAVKQPVALTYRLHDAVLVPPGVPNETVAQRTFVTRLLLKKCSPISDGPVSFSRNRVTVQRDELLKQPDGWVTRWAAELAARGCVASTDQARLAEEITEAVPIDSRSAFRLLYGDAVDFAAGLRVQMDRPIFRNPDGKYVFVNGPLKVTETADGVRIATESGGTFAGYERSWYGVQAKTGGVSVAPLYAERHVNGGNEHLAGPAENFLAFPPDASFFRLIYKQEQTEFTALVVAARTREELDTVAGKLAVPGANCGMVASGYCAAVGKGMAVNLFLPVTVNGKEELLHWGGTLRELVGRGDISTLKVSRPYNGKPADVEFDRASQAILGLRLLGGETISW